MGLHTKIEYLRKGGSTHNFWIGGCEKKSEGCQNCFAERIYKRFYGKDFSKPILSKNFDAPLKWKKPRVILVNDMSDFFHTSVDIEIVRKAWDVMGAARQHIFLLLTKRPKNIYIDMLKDITANIPYEHIWLGVSVENQKAADERIPELLKIPYFKKWISFEPLLGDIEIPQKMLRQISWAIVGGETGIKSGVSPIIWEGWARHLLGQCIYSKVPFFFKQMPLKSPVIPKDLMWREYPKELEAINDIHGKKD